MLVYVVFLILDSGPGLEKIAFHNLANPKNLNLDCTDYADFCF